MMDNRPGSAADLINRSIHYLVIGTALFLLNLLPLSAATAGAYHESPSQGSIESGIGLIRGWACEADQISILIDDAKRLYPVYGDERADTESICGDIKNGYSYLINWNLLSDGEHRLRAYADDKLITDIRFTVTVVGAPFLEDRQAELPLSDFPNPGDSLSLSWSQAHQNFVISRFHDADLGDQAFHETRLSIDPHNLTGKADYILSGQQSDGLVLESAGLEITSVTLDGDPWPYTLNSGDLNLDIPGDRSLLTVDYRIRNMESFEGLFDAGSITFTWPYYCHNLFPCVSAPSAGSRYRLQLTGIEEGMTAIYPHSIGAAVPAYQLGWVIGDYDYSQIGVTDAGTRVGLWSLPGRRAAATSGVERLPLMFDWLEKRLGPYPFGNDVASVEVDWPSVSGGGMEHHPYWHVETAAIGKPLTHIHEAIHGWYGNGVRLACWEDFVLSEGVASYLAAVAIGEAYGTEAESEVWADYDQQLRDAMAGNNHIAWPEGCGVTDVLDIYTLIPYMKGALFFRDLEQQIGRDQLIDSLGGFFKTHQGQATTFSQLLDQIGADSGFDPWPLAQSWLRTLEIP